MLACFVHGILCKERTARVFRKKIISQLLEVLLTELLCLHRNGVMDVVLNRTLSQHPLVLQRLLGK